ncbi:MAG: phosphate ABC transporter substrate-binding/OmpA family protein [Terrimicrobiaceae bacterium]
MTTKGKLALTILILALVGTGIWRWSDKIAPPAPSTNPGGAPTSAEEKKNVVEKKLADIQAITSKLLAADKTVELVGKSVIPPVQGTSSYKLETKNGKPVILFPINVWPGWAPIIVANGGLEPNDNSVFAKYGFYVKLTVVDDPVKNRDLYASGQSPIMWSTLDMVALFAPELCKDSRTIPNVPMQIDYSAGGDGVVARNNVKNINDLRAVNGVKKKVVVAQNTPSHFFIMSLLLDAKIDPDDIDFKWAADAPAAAKLFVQDKSLDAFVGFSPDIYTVSDMDPNTRLIVSTQSANRRIADVFAVRNDFVKDHPDLVEKLVKGILEGVEMVRKDPLNAADILSKAYGIPVEDCRLMVGKDGGIATGDAHLTNYRENENFFFDPMNPANFEFVYNQAAAIYQQLGAINTIIPASQVKYPNALAALKIDFKDSKDLSQPLFKPGMNFTNAESPATQILTRSVVLTFKPNTSVLDPEYDSNIPKLLDEIGKLAGGFGNAYIVIEGNADASRKGLVPEDMVRQLSYERADAVKKSILEKYHFDPNKFKVLGNGWNNPVAGATDPSNADHNKLNRRVEVKVYPLEGDDAADAAQ